MATQLKVKCIDQTLTLISSPVVASGGKLEDIIEFEFCSKWDGYTKTATFYQDKDNVYYSMIDNETNICTIPWEVLQKNGNLYFGVFGVKGDYVRTSQVLVYKVVEGAITENTTPSDPTPSIYQQIVNRLGTIEGKIPSQASTTNQLADKEFVNSSIATNTATFKGTFNIVDDLKLSRTATHEQVANAIATKVTDATNNDYSFVAIPNETITTEIDQYDRYKFNGTSWAYEFTLNNSSFTAEQWDAINSGISSNDVTQITTNKSSITNLQNNKQDKLVSGTNIKTINGTSLLGEGDMETPLPIANASTLGGVKIGDGINVTDDGTISAQEYSLPTASASVKGGIKIGSGLSITNEIVSADTSILQAKLVSGTNIKTIDNTSLLGNGNIASKLNMDLLWTNGSPTSAFSSQSITLTLTNYKLIYIEYYCYVDESNLYVALLNKQKYYALFGVSYFKSGKPSLYSERRCYINNNKITFESGNWIYTTDSGWATGSSEAIIPYRIYGIK